EVRQEGAINAVKEGVVAGLLKLVKLGVGMFQGLDLSCARLLDGILHFHLVPDSKEQQAKYCHAADEKQGDRGGPASGPFAQAFPSAGGPGQNGLVSQEAAEILSEVHGAGVTSLGLFFQAFQTDDVQLWGDVRIQAART